MSFVKVPSNKAVTGYVTENLFRDIEDNQVPRIIQRALHTATYVLTNDDLREYPMARNLQLLLARYANVLLLEKKNAQRQSLLVSQGLPLELLSKDTQTLTKIKNELNQRINVVEKLQWARISFDIEFNDIYQVDHPYLPMKSEALLKTGNYVVGQDGLEAGWYTVMACDSTGMGFGWMGMENINVLISVAQDSKESDLNSKIKISLAGKTHSHVAHVRLATGNTLTVASRVKKHQLYLYLRKEPTKKSLIIAKHNAQASEIIPGIYQVGRHIPAGNYVIKLPRRSMRLTELRSAVKDTSSVSLSVYDKDGLIKRAISNGENPHMETVSLYLYKGDFLKVDESAWEVLLDRYGSKTMIAFENKSGDSHSRC